MLNLKRVLTVAVSSYIAWKVTKSMYRYIVALKFYRNIPTPGNLPFLGSVLYLKNVTNTHDFHLKLIKEFGEYPYFVIWGWMEPNVLLLHPDSFEQICSSNSAITKNYEVPETWLGDGLICSSGDKWKFHRKKLTDVFHQDNLNAFLPKFHECAELLVNNISALNGKVFDFYVLIAEIMFRVSLTTLMGLSEDDKVVTEELRLNYLETVRKLSKLTLLYSNEKDIFGSWISKWMKNGREFHREIKKSDKFIKLVLKQRAKLYMEKKSSSVKVENRCLIDILLQLKYQDKVFSEQDIVDELNNFMFAGFDTSTSAIAWAAHFISSHPDVQAKIQEEIRINVNEQEVTSFINLATLNQFPYLDCVIKESQRLMPSVPITARYVDENTSVKLPRIPLANEKYDKTKLSSELPVGTRIILPYTCLHRNKRVWGDDAEEFKPERFSQEQRRAQCPFAFLPFSAGPRNCIGQKFAQINIKIILIHLLKNYSFKTDQNLNSCNAFAGATLDPTAGILLKAVKN